MCERVDMSSWELKTMTTDSDPRRRTIYNEDSQGVHEARPEHAEQDLRAWVDKAPGNIPVDVYSWCIAFPDIVMHDSKAGEVYGDRFEEPPANAAAVIRALRTAGTDVLKVEADQAHRTGSRLSRACG